MIDRYKKWEGSTSTSPSNLYLGHYKSILASDGTAQNSPNISFF